jgi:hypothetical protein
VPVTLTRRAALIAAAAVPLSACSAGTTDSEAAPADPDRAMRELATEDERVLITRYRATAEAHPDLESGLAAFIARHERHLDAIVATAPRETATGTPHTEAAARDVTADDIPGSRGDAITALREAEAAHTAARVDNSVTSYDYELAQVFASVAACESAHEFLLGEIA